MLLSKGTFTNIDVLGALGSTARGINPEGDIVGFYLNDTGFHGFLFSNRHERHRHENDDERERRGHDGAFTTIDAPDSSFTAAFSINPEGSIVGSRNNDGFLLRKGAFSFFDFPAADVTTIPLGISPDRSIVGFYFAGSFANVHGFLLSK